MLPSSYVAHVSPVSIPGLGLGLDHGTVFIAFGPLAPLTWPRSYRHGGLNNNYYINNNDDDDTLAKSQLHWAVKNVGLEPSLFFDEGTNWGRSRRILSPALNGHSNVANMIPSITKVSRTGGPALPNFLCFFVSVPKRTQVPSAFP